MSHEAISLKHFTDEEIFQQIDEAIQMNGRPVISTEVINR